MRTVCAPGLAPSTELRGNPLPRSEAHFTGIHARVARAIWPRKTAECWAAAAGVTPRMAKLWLAGPEVSERGKLALIREQV